MPIRLNSTLREVLIEFRGVISAGLIICFAAAVKAGRDYRRHLKEGAEFDWLDAVLVWGSSLVAGYVAYKAAATWTDSADWGYAAGSFVAIMGLEFLENFARLVFKLKCMDRRGAPRDHD